MTASSQPARPHHHGRPARRRASLLAVVLGASTLVLLAPPPASAVACSPGVSDYNGDGFADALVADPDATVAGHAKAGRLVVLYGDDGRVGQGARGVVTQATVGQTPETGDRFGWAVASADVNGDGCTDAVVGTPYEDRDGATDSGLMQVVWGSSAGLGQGGDFPLDQDAFAGEATAGDLFGFSVDAISATGTDQGIVAVGSPGWNVDGHDDAGYVGYLGYQDDFGDPLDSVQGPALGGPEAGDQYGYAVSLARISGDAGQVDALIGVPGEDIGGAVDAGAVSVKEEVFQGTFGSYDLTQNSPGVPGVAESGDKFGRSLDTTGPLSPGRLAVGAPGEDVGPVANAGSVSLFSTSGTAVSPLGSLDQETPGVGGAAEAGDLFGDHLAFLLPGAGATDTRLAVGVAYEDIAAKDSGAVQLFPLADLTADTTYTEDYAGVPGTAKRGDRFGAAVGGVVGGTERVLLVGVPDDVDRTRGVVDVIPVGATGIRAWVPGTDGVPASGAARFGQVVASSAS
jgi:hypothetical protein